MSGDPCRACGSMRVMEAAGPDEPRTCLACGHVHEDPSLTLNTPDSDFTARRRAARGGPVPTPDAAPHHAPAGGAGVTADAVAEACALIGPVTLAGDVVVHVSDDVYAALITRYAAPTNPAPAGAPRRTITTLHGVEIVRKS